MAKVLTQLKDAGEKALEIAKKKGVKEAEAYVVSNRVLTIRLVNNAVFEAKGVHDIGLGVRVIKDKGLGFSSTAQFSKRALEKVVDAAIAASNARKLPFKYSFPKPKKIPKVGKIFDKKLAELPPDMGVEIAYSMIENALEHDSKIADTAGVLNLVEYHTVVLNTHGVSAPNEGTFFEASLTATAKRGAKSAEGSAATAGRSLKEFKPEEIGRESAEMAVAGLKAKKIEAGKYTVVLDHEPTLGVIGYVAAFVSPMIAKLYIPLFLDKIGKKVASEELTVVDDPLMPGGIGSSPIDDEGVPSKKLTIINKGILKRFVYDSFYGALEKKNTTGSALRAIFAVGISAFPGKNYNQEPIPIPRNITVKPGKWKRDEIIEDTKKGLLVRRFHYTRVTNPTRGDFTSVLRMGLYQIKNGEIQNAVSKSRILDNILNMMKNINAISKELVVAGGWGDYAHMPAVRTKAQVTPIT
jgi:PmbA protein